MKIFGLMIFFTTCSFDMNLWGQIKKFEDMPQEILEQMDKMGVDNSPFLNCYESAYFNVVFEKTRKEFDFTSKKIAFLTGSSGKTIGEKKEYFEGEKISLQRRNTHPNPAQLLILTAAQKAESSGYDAVIVYWSKILLPVEQVIKRLKSQH